MNKRETKDNLLTTEEKHQQTENDARYKNVVGKYFDESIGNTFDKLRNFTKYTPRQKLTSFLSKSEIFKKILDIQGSIIECGVHLGGGLMSWAHLSSIYEPLNHQRKVIGFDTFSGFPGISEEDKKGNSENLHVGGLHADSYDDLTKCISVYDMNRLLNHIPKVSLIRGDACETIPKFLVDNSETVISLLYLDFDIYQPTKVALETFVSRIPKGGIIVFDQLNAKTFPGETLALSEILGINNIKIQRFSFDTQVSYAILD